MQQASQSAQEDSPPPTRQANGASTWIVGLIDRIDKDPVAGQAVVAELAVLVEVLGHGTRQRHHGAPVVLDRLQTKVQNEIQSERLIFEDTLC
jgi:hypothetical protein